MAMANSRSNRNSSSIASSMAMANSRSNGNSRAIASSMAMANSRSDRKFNGNGKFKERSQIQGAMANSRSDRKFNGNGKFKERSQVQWQWQIQGAIVIQEQWQWQIQGAIVIQEQWQWQIQGAIASSRAMARTIAMGWGSLFEIASGFMPFFVFVIENMLLLNFFSFFPSLNIFKNNSGKIPNPICA